jgi:chemotaxis protein methyltransferase CheR
MAGSGRYNTGSAMPDLKRGASPRSPGRVFESDAPPILYVAKETEQMVEITDKEFKKLADYIRSHYGIFLKTEKQSLLNARLANVVEQHNFKSFSEYYDYVVSDASGLATSILIDKVTTNYTYFMREPDHFKYINEVALPNFERSIKDYDLRVWSAGCSTGEEPYTLAIILEEYFKQKKRWDKKILATDISTQVLNIAQKGVFEHRQIEMLPPMWKLNYFTKLDKNTYAVSDRLKKEVIFRRHNLVQNFSFHFRRKFHIIMCRNVMIYFDKKTRDMLVNSFYNITEPGGYLFIGHTESLDREATHYKYVAPAIYRKV